MEVRLLKSDLVDLLNEPDEETRIGIFWCFAPDYDKCIGLFKKIISDEKIKEIVSEEGKIKRVDSLFLIQDASGNEELFTAKEIYFFIDLWEKSQQVVPNTIIYPKTDL